MTDMHTRFIQINIQKGKYLDNLIDFLKEENPDIVSMQEVTSGDANYWNDKTINLFEFIKEKLDYNGIFFDDIKYTEVNARSGNAVISKLPIANGDHLLLADFRPVSLKEFNPKIFPFIPRSIVNATLIVNDMKIHSLSVHGAWTELPVDTEEKLRQARMIANYLQSLKEPFILGGDLNMPPNTQTIGTIDKVANNLMLNSGIKQTTHPTIHHIAPKGLLVDYIYTSKDFTVKSMSSPEVTVSDHLPVIAELEF